MRLRPLPTTAVLLLLAACESSTPAEAPPAAPAAAAPAPAAEAPAPAADEHAAHAAAAPGELLPVPEGAQVSFLAPAAGAKISGPAVDGKVSVAVSMGAQNIAVKPAGPLEPNSGHHHILIDAAPVAPGVVVPKDETHLHFGQGQTEATLQLAPGKHTLMLQFADGLHRSYGPALSQTIEIEVEAVGGSPTPGAGTADEAEEEDEEDEAP